MVTAVTASYVKLASPLAGFLYRSRSGMRAVSPAGTATGLDVTARPSTVSGTAMVTVWAAVSPFLTSRSIPLPVGALSPPADAGA
jgi:hypothetical protein